MDWTLGVGGFSWGWVVTDKEIDIVYDIFDELFLNDQFEHANYLLDIISPSLDADFLIAILTATLPAKDLLPNRKPWADSAQKYLSSYLTIGLL